MIAVLAVIDASACSQYLPRYKAANSAFETGFYENIENPRLALLEYRLGKYFAQQTFPYTVVCAAAERPSVITGITTYVPLGEETERKLIERFPALSPLSRCEAKGLNIIAADTGEAAAIFDVNEFSCGAADTCLGWGGYYANGQHGWSYYRMTFERGEWRIKPEDLGIVLT